MQLESRPPLTLVAPRRGAWIEIPISKDDARRKGSPLAEGRGLKCN